MLGSYGGAGTPLGGIYLPNGTVESIFRLKRLLANPLTSFHPEALDSWVSIRVLNHCL